LHCHRVPRVSIARKGRCSRRWSLVLPDGSCGY